MSLECILLIYSVVEILERGKAHEIEADLETLETAQNLTEALKLAGYQVITVPIRIKEDIITAVRAINRETTLVFNLCEAFGGVVSTDVSEVPRLLEQLEVCYTGSTAEVVDLCVDKGLFKACLVAQGVSTAPYQLFHTGDEAIHVPLPALIKPAREDCSLGITNDSVVYDEIALRRQVNWVIQTYKQPALAELFLTGREFSVSMWGNGDEIQVLPIGEIDFSKHHETMPPLFTFETKWNEWGFHAVYPAHLDEVLKEQIEQLALQTYQVVGMRDYARLDLREHHGQLYVLEVNDIPCLMPSSGFPRAAQLLGYDYSGMARRIVEMAWQRYNHD